MGGPFEIGEIVVCVDAEDRDFPVPAGITYARVALGAYYRVEAVFRCHDRYGDFWGCVLDIDDPDDGGVWECDRFRKIENDTGFDFREQLRAKPKEPVRAEQPLGTSAARASLLPSSGPGTGGGALRIAPASQHSSTPEAA